jgi:hypothetical protein
MEESNQDPIPTHFDTLWEAAEFWDTHSAADYWDEMEEVVIEFDIQERLLLIPVQGQVYRQIKQKAAGEGRPLPEVVNEMLMRELA